MCPVDFLLKLFPLFIQGKKTEASSTDWIKWRISHFSYDFSLSHGENADFVKEANTFQPLILLSSNSGHLKDEWREEKNTQKNAI